MEFKEPIQSNFHKDNKKTPENKIKEEIDFVFEQNQELAQIGTNQADKTIAEEERAENIKKARTDILKQFDKLENNYETKRREEIYSIFEQNLELIKIGTKEQYFKYLENIFPASNIKDIVYRGTYKGINSDEFNEKHVSREHGGIYAEGKYFTLDKLYAALYAFNNKDITEKSGFGQIRAAIIGISNPYYYDLETDFDKSLFNEKKFTEDLKLKGYDGVFIFKDKDIEQAKNILNIIKEKYPNVTDEYINNFINNLLTTNEEPVDYDDRQEFRGALNAIGNEYSGKNEIVVFEPGQIHTLGSKQDIEGFKNFVAQNKEE